MLIIYTLLMYFARSVIHNNSDLGLDEVLSGCQTLLDELSVPANQSAVDYVINTPYFKLYKPTLERHIKDLSVTQRELMTSWQNVESSLLQVSRGQKYKAKAEKVCLVALKSFLSVNHLNRVYFYELNSHVELCINKDYDDNFCTFSGSCMA